MSEVTIASLTQLLAIDESINADETMKLLQAEHVDGVRYTIETLADHVDACLTKEGYVAFLEKIATDPSSAPMYTFVITAGPSGVYGLLGALGSAGLVDKKKVAAAAKITVKKKVKAVSFHKAIWADIAEYLHTEANTYFMSKLPEYKKSFPEMGDVESYIEFLWLVKRATINHGVETMKVEATGVSASVSLGYRLDAHTPSRNGGFDPKTGKLTEDGIKRLEERAAKAAAKAAADADDDDRTEEDEEDEVIGEAVGSTTEDGDEEVSEDTITEDGDEAIS